jgi:hypothetical protein
MREQARREGDVSPVREPPCDVFDVRREPEDLVDHNDAGAWFPDRRTREIRRPV